MKSTSLSVICLLGLLGACAPGGQPTLPAPTPGASASSLSFGAVISRRSLSPANLGSLAGSGSRGATAPGPSQPAPAPVAPGSDRGAAGMPPFPYYGGGEFNNYIPVMAEESLLAGSSAGDPGSVYQQTVLPLLRQWDPAARLVESRGNTRPDRRDPNSYEYVYVPGPDGGTSLQLLPDWVFRFASTPRKETLTIYVSAKETRVYRVVWSEPDIAIARVKLTAVQAESIARQALNDRSEKPAYPVYPEPGSDPAPNGEVVYTLPEELNWTVSLGQQGDQLIYYLYTSYAEATGKPGIAVIPSPDPAIGLRPELVPATRVDTGSAAGTNDASPAPLSELSPSPQPSPEPTAGPTAESTVEPTVEPSPEPSPVLSASPSPSPVSSPSPSVKPSQKPSPQPGTSPLPPDCREYMPPYVYLSASASIDAVSGKVLSLMRPVRYAVSPGVYCIGGGSTGTRPPPATTAPAGAR